MASPRVFTIPASAPFLPTLIAAIRDGRLGFAWPDDPLALAQATLYLPTRRACRLARGVFLDVLGADVAILPRIVPIGDIDEDEIAFAEAATGSDALDVPDALGGLQRRLMLAQLILKWTAMPEMRTEAGVPLIANTPSAALSLADTLARLIDDMTTRQVSWDKLDTLVPDDVDKYWQLTLKFLDIARKHWPAILEQNDRIEPAMRRDLLIAAEARRLEKAAGPVIAAGSTGSMPATAMLLETIAKLPHGAVVLPGLDTHLDDQSWKLVDGSLGHPQVAMHALLAKLGIARDEVTPLAEAGNREAFAAEAMRPAGATELWRDRAEFTLDHLVAIPTANADEEALTIAVVLREAAEQPGKTAALVTPDRALARRVVAHLARWNVPVDDSGGDALPDTPAGIFARLAAQTAIGGLEPVTLLALLKHPLFQIGDAYAVAAIEIAALRGPRPKPGSAGLALALSHQQTDPQATDLVARIAAALAPLENLGGKPLAFSDLAARHRQVVAALSETIAFAGTDGRALEAAFDEIDDAASALPVRASDYAELFQTAITDRVVRRHEEPDVRVRIYGLLEARLQSADRVVLGSLVEGVWPPETRSDPWLSRPMRSELGLDLPERRISLSAHDFAQALGAKEVILTYAGKLGGAPTVTSRFLQRVAAVAGADAWNDALARGAHYLAWARGLDEPQIKSGQRIKRPEPRPPLAARPTRLSVTEIEHWLRDPYTIYARHILKLRPLDAVDTPPGAADRGTVIHGAIEEFTKTYAEQLPADPLAELIALGRKHFAPLDDYPEARAFWWPRFERIARWFTYWEAGRRAALSDLHAEAGGLIEIPSDNGVFTLRTRADRIERLSDGRYAILDYKTGRVPGDREVQVGLAPQLTLEGAILRQGGFARIPAGASIAEFVYVGMRGGDPAGVAESVVLKDSDPDAESDNALRKLTGLVNRFADQKQPYSSLVSPMWKTRYGDYDHLARVKEWSVEDDEEIF